jgi:hypothetical protein
MTRLLSGSASDTAQAGLDAPRLRYSQELLDRLTPARRKILQPIPPRPPGSPAGVIP